MKRTLLSVFVLTSVAASAQLYDQTANLATNGIISDYMTDLDTIVKSADNFVVPVGGTFEVTSVTVHGFRNNAGPNMDSMLVEIYANAGSIPGAVLYSDVHMLSGGGVPSPSPDTALTITIPTQTLTAGTYWISVAGYAPAASRWNWTVTTGPAINGDAALIDEDDFFGAGATNWTAFSTVGLTDKNLAFIIDGTDYYASVEESSNFLSIYPNPANETVFIKTNAASVEKVMIYSISGELVYSDYSNTKMIDVSTFSTGIYVIQVQTPNGTLTEKFIKE